MKDVGDLVSWVLGILASLLLLNWRVEKKADNDKFSSLFEEQKLTRAKLSSVETKIDLIDAYHIKSIEEIKAQNIKIAADVTNIRIVVASLPKRKED